MKYIDVHSHIQFSQFDEDRESVLLRMREKGIGAIVVGCDFESSRRASELARREDFVWATIGVHPTDKQDEGFDSGVYEKLLHEKVVGVGECGLDYFRKDGTSAQEVQRQKRLFHTQIEFALSHDLPLMIHCRPSSGTLDAYDDLLHILKEYKQEHGDRLRGNVHFFAGDVRVAEACVALGFTLSFTGVVTFTGDYDAVVKAIPETALLSETDCPYVTPVPHRGVRNESSYVDLVVRHLAYLRGEEVPRIEAVVLQNARRLFTKIGQRP